LQAAKGGTEDAAALLAAKEESQESVEALRDAPHILPTSRQQQGTII